jgi:hypothetical protein
MRLAWWLPMRCPSSKLHSRGVSEPQQLHSNLPEALRDRPFKLSADAKRVFVAYQFEENGTVLQSLSGSASTPYDPLPMVTGEWNGNHNDRAFPMVGVPA